MGNQSTHLRNIQNAGQFIDAFSECMLKINRHLEKVARTDLTAFLKGEHQEMYTKISQEYHEHILKWTEYICELEKLLQNCEASDFADRDMEVLKSRIKTQSYIKKIEEFKTQCDKFILKVQQDPDYKTKEKKCIALIGTAFFCGAGFGVCLLACILHFIPGVNLVLTLTEGVLLASAGLILLPSGIVTAVCGCMTLVGLNKDINKLILLVQHYKEHKSAIDKQLTDIYSYHVLSNETIRANFCDFKSSIASAKRKIMQD